MKRRVSILLLNVNNSLRDQSYPLVQGNLREYLPISLLHALKNVKVPASHTTHWVKKAVTLYPIDPGLEQYIKILA